MKKEKVIMLEQKSRDTRRGVLEAAVKAGAGHIAPSFSCIDILAVLYYGGILNIDSRNPDKKSRDRFILSKGHASIALYVILADLGFFPPKELEKFTQDGSVLGGHGEDVIPGVEIFSGSLGHGLPIASGIAFAAKLDKKRYKCFSLLGDGECHEGSVWEAAMFAAHHKLDNLVAIIDHNGLSATNFLRDYLSVEPLKKKWQAFGWNTVVVDGHCHKAVHSALSSIISKKQSGPTAVIALTTKGKGISFMENCPIWHYRIPQGKELNIARQELSKQ